MHIVKRTTSAQMKPDLHARERHSDASVATCEDVVNNLPMKRVEELKAIIAIVSRHNCQ